MVILATGNIIPAFAVSYDTDYYYSCGPQYWGVKTFTGSTPYFGHNPLSGSCSAKAGAGITQTGDTRTNYFETTVVSSGPVAYEASIQGKDAFGNAGNTPAVTPVTFSIPGNDNNLSLDTQFVWLTDSTNKPSGSTSYANVITDLWAVPADGTTSLALVIDYASASLHYSSGSWAKRSIAIGGNYSDAIVDLNSGKCTYHVSLVSDNNSAANTWRQAANYTSIASDIQNAVNSQVYQDHTAGVCKTTVTAQNAAENQNSKWNVIGIESGVEVGNSGTETGAFSYSELTH